MFRAPIATALRMTQMEVEEEELAEERQLILRASMQG